MCTIPATVRAIVVVGHVYIKVMNPLLLIGHYSFAKSWSVYLYTFHNKVNLGTQYLKLLSFLYMYMLLLFKNIYSDSQIKKKNQHILVIGIHSLSPPNFMLKKILGT